MFPPLTSFYIHASSLSSSVTVLDYYKLLRRCASLITFHPGQTNATESQRLSAALHCVDVLSYKCSSSSSSSSPPSLAPLLAKAFGLTVAAVTARVQGEDNRDHTVKANKSEVVIGDVALPVAKAAPQADSEPPGPVARQRRGEDKDGSSSSSSSSFVATSSSVRLLRSVACCVSAVEPCLLVGETGCGKTTVVQSLAGAVGRKLIVQNLSLQTDGGDLLGGYRPVEVGRLVREVYAEFRDRFLRTFPGQEDGEFMKFARGCVRKGAYKKLGQCFKKAAKMGAEKEAEKLRGAKRPAAPPTEDRRGWDSFAATARRFERQREASEKGLAFAFEEGVLVKAIREGSWVLLDEVNLASGETLQRLFGLLDGPKGTITVTERGDTKEVPRHPDFRLFAAMNPATDAGKKDLPPAMRR